MTKNGHWQETKLWLAIKDSSAEVRLTVENCMPNIEAVLKSGGTGLPDFTLHDEQHGFRVAERIVTLLPDRITSVLTDLDVAMALLASYLHDIGMTPSRDIARRHWQFLSTADRTLLDGNELRELQRWLDAEHNGLQPPLKRSTPSEIDESEQIFAYYCRHKHNDWSEEWTRKHLENVSPGLYATWIDDLVTLCRSHHEGLAELRTGRFEPRLAGTPARVLNLRYLAALLRTADVLEFDPERTPRVILEHRDVAPKSRIFWYKDHNINFYMDKQRRELVLSARTPNAFVHRAILDTALSVDNELVCCSTLQHEGAFRKGTIPDDARERYKWLWPARLNLDVAEKDESFVYIDGAFRPDSHRLLRLLSGTALYRNPMAATRELLQNAVDAVREQIAYERLSHADPSDPRLGTTLANLHKIRMALEHDKGRVWLRCSDDGTGMTKDIIERHLLVSGSDVRAEVRALERDARAKGFSVGRTGQFGIGVLSYFMIADHMEFLTRRSAEAGDPDHTAWRFIIEGVGSFGELSRTSRSTKGTEIRLQLRTDVIGQNVNTWFEEMLAYVGDLVRYLPCHLEIRDETGSGRSIQWGPGWTAHPAQLTEKMVASLRGHGQLSELPTIEEREKHESDEARWLELRLAAVAGSKLFGPKEMMLTDGSAELRVWLAYFILKGDASLGFMDLDDYRIRLYPDNSMLYLPSGITLSSWKGFSVDARAGFGNLHRTIGGISA